MTDLDDLVTNATDGFNYNKALTNVENDKADSPRGWSVVRHSDGRVTLTHTRRQYVYVFSANGQTVQRTRPMEYGGLKDWGTVDVTELAGNPTHSEDLLAVKHYNALTANADQNGGN